VASVQRIAHLAALLPPLLVLAVLLSAAGGGTASPPPGGPRYLALGDSLAESTQAHGPRNQGYAEDLWLHELQYTPDLELVKLGRGGETAARMLHSPRTGPSQLQQALEALRAGQTTLVTIDIGANDVEHCQRGNGFDARCIDAGLASLRRSLPLVLRRLRAAAPSTRIVGINYYNSFLGAWVQGAGGRRLARRSVPVERRINATLTAVYRKARVRVADVESAFATDRLDSYARLAPYGRLPLAVARVCRWTWSCAGDGDDHANSAGYAVIARTVARLVDRRRAGR
jgi:lysophospholipase L1-like esterase